MNCDYDVPVDISTELDRAEDVIANAASHEQVFEEDQCVECGFWPDGDEHEPVCPECGWNGKKFKGRVRMCRTHDELFWPDEGCLLCAHEKEVYGK